MEGFINKSYYVECHSREEIKQFMLLCEDFNLKLRNGSPPSHWVIPYSADGAVFAYNWMGYHDGISYWRHSKDHEYYHSDGMKPHVPFTEIAANQAIKEIPDILDLL